MSAAASMPSHHHHDGDHAGDGRASGQRQPVTEAGSATDALSISTGLPTPRRSPAAELIPNNVVPLRPQDRAFIPAPTRSPEQANQSPAQPKSWLAELPFIFVMVLVVMAIGVALAGALRVGIFCLVFAVSVGFLLRALLPDADAGMLKSRGKLADLGILAVAGLALTYLALSLPIS